MGLLNTSKHAALLLLYKLLLRVLLVHCTATTTTLLLLLLLRICPLVALLCPGEPLRLLSRGARRSRRRNGQRLEGRGKPGRCWRSAFQSRARGQDEKKKVVRYVGGKRGMDAEVDMVISPATVWASHDVFRKKRPRSGHKEVVGVTRVPVYPWAARECLARRPMVGERVVDE